MHPALRKGTLFLQKNTPLFSIFFYQKTPSFSTFLQKITHPISFPAYGPAYCTLCLTLGPGADFTGALVVRAAVTLAKRINQDTLGYLKDLARCCRQLPSTRSTPAEAAKVVIRRTEISWQSKCFVCSVGRLHG